MGTIQAGQLHGVMVKRLDFSDTQDGKGACDRESATIKAHIRIHLNEGHDVETASQMVNAMKSSGGVSALCALLCDSVIPPNLATKIKFDRVSTVTNAVYGDGYIRVWKAYGIGPGKKIPLAKINIPANFRIAQLTSLSADDELSDKFVLRSQEQQKIHPFLEKENQANLLQAASFLHAPRKGARHHIRDFRPSRDIGLR